VAAARIMTRIAGAGPTGDLLQLIFGQFHGLKEDVFHFHSPVCSHKTTAVGAARYLVVIEYCPEEECLDAARRKIFW
jgi:hypothetical protein